MRILTLLHSSHDIHIALPMAPMLMCMCPDPNHMSSSPPLHPGKLPHRQQHMMSHPMTTQDMPHSSGHAPAPLTCPAPSQHAAAIPHASHTPFVCPSPSHDLMHVPRPPSMRPNTFQRTTPLLDALYCIATALSGDGQLFPVWMVSWNSAGGYIVTGGTNKEQLLPLAIIHS